MTAADPDYLNAMASRASDYAPVAFQCDECGQPEGDEPLDEQERALAKRYRDGDKMRRRRQALRTSVHRMQGAAAGGGGGGGGLD